MTTYQINPAAKKVEYSTAFDLQDLESLGWDFSEFYHERSESIAEQAKYATYEDAVMGVESPHKKEAEEYLGEATTLVRSEHLVYVRLRTEGKKLNTYFSLHNVVSNETYGWEVSGDDKKNIENVIYLLSLRGNYVRHTHDESEDSEGNDAPTFIQA